MRKLLFTIALALSSSLPSLANASVSIAIDVLQYPTLQRIPGYPVYYAPGMRANYFFYDGMYWVYTGDAWYASPWYDGPWDLVAIDAVPLYVLRVPVRYYGYPPVMFSRWVMDAPPRWDSVWGPSWSHRHHNWQHWNRAGAPPPAPLPRYQQQFTRANYPNEAQRRELAQQHYKYAPRDTQVRRQTQTHSIETANQPPVRPNPPHQTQPQPVRQFEPQRANGPRPIEHEDAPARRHPPPRETQMAQPERPQMHTDQREFAHDQRPEHGGRPERASKPEKEEGHDSGKHH